MRIVVVSHSFAQHVCPFFSSSFFDADKGWLSQPPISGEFKGETAGGCTNYPSVKDNPQFLLTVTEPTTVVINMSQTDSRGTSEKLKAIGLEVYSNKGVRITRTRTGPLICSNPEGYIFRREISLEHKFVPTPEPYTVLISTFDANQETKWALQVFSDKPIKFELAPPVKTNAAKK